MTEYQDVRYVISNDEVIVLFCDGRMARQTDWQTDRQRENNYYLRVLETWLTRENQLLVLRKGGHEQKAGLLLIALLYITILGPHEVSWITFTIDIAPRILSLHASALWQSRNLKCLR